MRRFLPGILSFIFAPLLIIAFCTSPVFAQGSIFGTVVNADAGVPAQGEISFYGFLDDTDEEIRLETSTGAGYDAGNWFDDFQNYLTEAAGNPYDHYFYNTANNQGYILSGLIPNNSFQQENITLAPVDWPDAPSGLAIGVNSATEVTLYWSYASDISCHVYRRQGSSDGSFFRIDDLSGSLSNSGVSDTFFIDDTVDSLGSYDYLVIAEDLSGRLGPHSEIITVNIAGSVFIPGDANADGLVNVGDCVYVINYIFREGPYPMPLASGDTNCDGLVNVGDVVYTINYIFREGPAPGCP